MNLIEVFVATGEPFYPKYGVVSSPVKRGAKGRRGSLIHVHGGPKPADLPLSQEVISNLPALCFPGKNETFLPTASNKFYRGGWQ